MPYTWSTTPGIESGNSDHRRVEPSMSVSRNVTVPVGNREPGPPSALLGNAASAHTGDPLRSIMARPNLGPGSAAYICQMAYLHGAPASNHVLRWLVAPDHRADSE